MKLMIVVTSMLYVSVKANSSYSFEFSGNQTSSEEQLPLPELDKSLTEEILNPKPGNDDKIYQQLFQYYNGLYHIHEVVNQDLSMEKDVLDLGKEIYKNGGPVFINKPLDYEKMKSAYKWEDVFFEEFQETVSKVKHLWGMVFLCYQNKAWRTEDTDPLR